MKDKFIIIIESLGFREKEATFGAVKEFETEFRDEDYASLKKHGGFSMDNMELKYTILYYYKGLLTVLKESGGGFLGGYREKEIIFTGKVETEEDFRTILRCVRFNAKNYEN